MDRRGAEDLDLGGPRAWTRGPVEEQRGFLTPGEKLRRTFDGKQERGVYLGTAESRRYTEAL